MILKGNRRSGAKDLALHLMKVENDHVEIHELRGFVSDTLMGALNETYAMSKGTRCQKFIYSMSVNPPPGEKASTADILDAIEKSEKTLKLKGQPRAIVFHEKDGRRHAHVVWSLIDSQKMKAVRLRDDRIKLQPLTRELFIEHGWEMPPGLLDKTNRDPRNYTLKEYHQAKKSGKNARDIKGAIQTAWAISDSRTAFIHALEERGFKLAKGAKKGKIVCVDMFGVVRAIPKALGIPVKAVRAKIGDGDDLQSVDKAMEKTASLMHSKLNSFKEETASTTRQKTRDFEHRRQDLVRRQRLERQSLKDRQEKRQAEECRVSRERFRNGIKGLWDGLRGHNKRIRSANELEALESLRRDRQERDTLIHSHLEQCQHINLFKMELGQEFVRERQHIERDVQTYNDMRREYSRGGPSL